MSKFQVTADGHYGRFGGAWVPEMLQPNVDNLRENYLKILESEEFKSVYLKLLRDYVGRPTPLTYAESLSAIYNTNVQARRLGPHGCPQDQQRSGSGDYGQDDG